MVSIQTQPEADIQKLTVDQATLDRTVVVSQIDLSDESFMHAFSGNGSDLSSIEHGLARFLARESAFEEQRAVEQSQSLVRALLTGIAVAIEDPALREKFLQDGIVDTDLLEVLHYASSDQRLEFLTMLCDLSSGDLAVRQFLSDKLDNALHACESVEKAKLLRHLLQRGSELESQQLMNTVLRSSDGLTQLNSIMFGLDERMLALNNPELTEFVAHFRLDQKMRLLNRPGLLIGDVTSQHTSEVKAEFEAAMRTALFHAQYDDSIKQSIIATDFAKIAQGNLDELKLDWEKCVNDSERKELLNRLILKSGLELWYGIRLSHAEGEMTQFGLVGSRRWSVSDIADLHQVFGRMPEGKVLFTPLLTEIQRVPNLGRGVLAARYPDGVIRVADLAIDHSFISDLYAGQSSLQVTLTHELGHSIQIGIGFFGKEDSSNPALEEADPLYDFDEFTELSGWEIVGPERYTVTNLGLSVLLDGHEIQLGYPVEHNGKSRIYFLVGGMLLGYDAQAQFTIDPYSRATPWEDFAEAWCEYLLMPERLINFAPEKFLFLEREFRVYENKPELWEKATDLAALSQ